VLEPFVWMTMMTMMTVTMTVVMTMGTAAPQAKPGGRLCQVTEMMECEW
jgi:hypothetical protein